MIRLLFITLLLSSVIQEVSAQGKYFVSFIDKQGTPYTTQNPSEYLTSKSIERRIKQNISINESDLPVSPQYVQQVEETGANLLYTLKWFNGAVIETFNDDMISQIAELESVKEIQKIYEPGLKSAIMPEEEIFPIYTWAKDPNDYYFYGSSSTQIKMLNGSTLHNRGFRGKGITIGILDAGFYKTNSLAAFDSLWAEERILLTKDFVNPSSNIFEEHSHGMIVLSAMAGNIPGELIGSAPEASYILIRSEDANSEQIIEEYNWAAAAELADSLGVDIINSSLGYYIYDATWQNHEYIQMDGKTTPAARAANFANEKGILVVASAGNEGENDWKHIITPADAYGAIAVGAVNELGQYASFSSIGPSADGRIKPDVVAMGVRTVIQAPTGQIGSANGTSLSAPIISGLAACLWQALPTLTVKELTKRMMEYSSNSTEPNNRVGYGLPNFAMALDSLLEHPNEKYIHLYPNPTKSVVNIYLPKPLAVDSSVQLITATGIVVRKENIMASSIFHTLHIPEKYPSGLYLIKLITGNESMTGRVIKTNYGIE